MLVFGRVNFCSYTVFLSKKNCILLRYSKITTGFDKVGQFFLDFFSHGNFHLGKSRNRTEIHRNPKSKPRKTHTHNERFQVFHDQASELSQKVRCSRTEISLRGKRLHREFFTKARSTGWLWRQAIQFIYSGWFLLELVLRVAVDGRKLFYGEDG